MKHLIYLLAALIVLFYSTHSLAQLDSVWYEGPSVGSVDSGVVVSTDDFTYSPMECPDQITERYLILPDQKEIYFEFNESKLPEYVYIEDTNVHGSYRQNGGQTVLLRDFEGMTWNGCKPPDPHIAVGPNHIITTVNCAFSIWDKQGNRLRTINPDSWCGQVVGGHDIFDPQIIFDHYEGKWFMVWATRSVSTLSSYFVISYSDDDNPIGIWYTYAISSKLHGTVSSNTWGDYHKVGFDDEALYIGSNQIDFAISNIVCNKIRIISKSELYSSNGGPITWTDIWNMKIPGQGSGSELLSYIQPTISYTPGDGGYLFWSDWSGNSAYILYKILDPVSAPNVKGKVVPVEEYITDRFVSQKGGGQEISILGSCLTTVPIVRNGFLYGSHSMRNSTAPAYSSIRYFIVDLDSTVITEVAELGADEYYYFFPALTIDQNHNIAVTYSRSGDEEYIGAYYSTKNETSPAGLSSSYTLREGVANYVTILNGRNRWGDYMGIFLDPVTESNIWMLTEYVASTNIWGTWVGELIVDPVSVDDNNNIPKEYSLHQNYPNPFNPSTKIKYSVPQTSNILIKVFDILGNKIETLVNEEKAVGSYMVELDGNGLPSGIYFYRIQAVPTGRQVGSFVETKKMILLR